MRCFDFTHAIVRAPGRSVVDGLSAQDGPAPDYEAVVREHDGYARALAACGLEVTMLDPLEAHPDALFVEDPALVFPEGAILLRPGAESRADEAALLRPELERHFADVQVLGEGHADGGDVMVTPDIVMIGLSARTDAAGAVALSAALARLGRRAMMVVPPAGALHLKTIASLIDEETILTTPEGAASGLFSRFRQIVLAPDEAAAANAVRINDTLLLPAHHPRIADQLAGLGYHLVLLDTTHVARIDAGLSCMSLRW
ncbi:arginine deiminase family protein [Sphingomonas sp. AR_OL41]|uniref:arginine deiminase family protein n=1 Tax=Sphingomonas sp. AR_OL41 TaxID=3042729 RepID=UPI00247FEB11|nr:arginine deiminase family protein [Sphingomonas sp. AR_OL41]MDH7975050.1 arginine deiminase family protein [Sphingomonas sp. AR_OL41]